MRVRALILASDAYRQAFARRVGLGVTDAAALGHLYHHGQQTPGRLAVRLQMTPASVTAMIDRLDAAGYLIRIPHPRDRRSALVRLTAAGARLIQDGFDEFGADVDRAVETADVGRLPELVRVLAEVTAALDARAEQPYSVHRPADPATDDDGPGLAVIR